MASPSTSARPDHEAYSRLVEPHRAELRAHCYRMLGSLHDAEDALQETLLRAWRRLDDFEGRSSLRSWLYTIATNVCLNAITRGPSRVLPVDYGPASDPHDASGRPLAESVWMEPYPDGRLGVEDGLAGPEARYEMRESIELAFVAALQHLPGTQRAVLILRDVLGFSARETAAALDTTEPSVNSALQRARKATDERLPERSQQATLRDLGDERLRDLVRRYSDAMERGDVDAVVEMLAEDAAWSMPPLATWFRGHAAIRAFLQRGPLSGEWRWRHVPTQVNGQRAVAVYRWDEVEEGHLPFALDTLTLDHGRIKEITAFITRSAQERDRRCFDRPPEQGLAAARVPDFFERFGLPARLD
jgi:RNA polymerase sigma-70 factor, ECF subfamily